MDWSKETVYVHGPGALPYMAMFLNKGLKGTNDMDKASIICFTGGEDVDPSLYGESNLMMGNRAMSFFNKKRDEQDSVVFGIACANDVIKVGICRGGQFLNVMNGGKMWQHVTDHAVSGGHDLIDNFTGEVVRVTSTHHQMMRPAKDGVVIAVARESKARFTDGERWTRSGAVATGVDKDLDDIEVVWYPDSKSFCFQPHPEFNIYPECTDYFFSSLERCISK